MIQLEQLQEEPVLFDESFAPGLIDYTAEGIRQVAALKVKGIATLLEREIHIQGSLETRVEMDCARCLEPVAQDVKRPFDLFYHPLDDSPEGSELAVPRGEEDLGFYSGPGLVLEEVAKEQVLLSLPMRSICRPDCAGWCPICGINRNREKCNCSEPTGDPRWAALKKE